MELTEVLYEVGADAVATVTINRPEQRNALAPSTLRQLTFAMGQAADDAAVRAVVLTGAGDKAFCAGADLARFAAPSSGVDRHLEHGEFVALFLACERLGKPLIGCVNGHALAAGFGLALCCDLIVCADTATFGAPEITVGVWPMMITSIVTRNLGRKRAMELFLTGARVDAATALRWGFVNRVVPAAEALENAHAWAAQIGDWSPLVMRLGRDAFYATDSLDFESALRHLQAQLTVVASTEDFHEGVTAFLEKRAPHFRGR
jgi:enoyl-CoA hydratase